MTGMTNNPEVKDLPRGPDRGNPTPRRQGHESETAMKAERTEGASRKRSEPPARACPEEVVGARSDRTRVKRRKAYTAGKPANGGEALFLSVAVCVVATGRARRLLFLPSEICRAPRER